MGALRLLSVLFLVHYCTCTELTSGHSPNMTQKHYFRKDYTYLNYSDSFFKIHTIPKTWEEAKKMCEMEDATLFHPKDDMEASEVNTFWTGIHNFPSVYVALNDLLTLNGIFSTFDGHYSHDVYNNWGPGQPDNDNDNEHCVTLSRDGILNDVSCTRRYPYICKKARQDVLWDKHCNFSRTDYTWDARTERCYKVHTDPKNWTEAMAVCFAEQSYLAVVDTSAEADFLMALVAAEEERKSTGFLKGAFDQFLIGFHNRFGEGWTTIQGKTNLTGGYFDWDSGKPSGDGSCGAISYGGCLNVGCHIRMSFICEHEVYLPTSVITGVPNSEYDYDD